MQAKLYFISDVHLRLYDSESEQAKRQHLLAFLQTVEQQSADLYIVGDLFDFWFEYKYVIPRHYFKIIRALQRTAEQGCHIHLVVGNHDYWVGDFFENEIGVQIHRKALDLQIGRQKWLITHGDGILKRDTGYRLLKKVLRHSLAVFLFRLLHPDLAFAIAAKISQRSRHATLRQPPFIEAERKEIIQFGREKFSQGYDCVITGHFHLPTDYREGRHIFLNLGDWMRYYTFAYYNGRALRLCYWDIEASGRARK